MTSNPQAGTFTYNTLVVDVPTYPMAALEKKKKDLLDAGKQVFDYGTGDPTEPTPKFIPKAMIEGIPVVSQYPSVKGTPKLRQEIANYISRRFGVTVDWDKQILPVFGSKEAIYNIAFLFIGPNNPKDTVIYPVPGYPVMERSARIAGAKLLPVPLLPEKNYLFELSELPVEQLNRTAIAWINYPNNPTGVECDLDYLVRQVETARKHGILLCSDECYADIYFGDQAPPSVLQVTTEGVLAFHSCSKRSGMTGYRSGFVAGDADVIAKYTAFRSAVGTAPPVFIGEAAAASWAEEHHAHERVEIFRNKRDVLLEFFSQHGLEVTPSEATLYLWVKCPPGYDGESYAAKLLDLGIIVSPGVFFGEHCTDYIRLALVPSVEQCKETVALWSRVES